MAAPCHPKPKLPTGALSFSLSTLLGWVVALGLTILVLGGLVMHMGGWLQLLYPLTTLAVGILLYWRYPTVYLGFTWWLWLLTSEVRRLVDYQQGWTSQSPVMLAPYLVTALTILTVLRHLPKMQLQRLFPFGLILLGLIYGYSVGVVKVGPLAATFDLLGWLVPVAVAFHLAVYWRSYPRYRRVIQRTFTWGVLVIGLYGLLQFVDPPAWDRYWMLNAPINSIGSPEPFEVRVFSTLNSPGPFAIVMMAGLLVLFSGGGSLRWPAAGVGYVSFLLSLVRSAWGAWAVGLLFLIMQRGRFRLLTALPIIGLIALPLLSFGPVATIISMRLQGLGDLQQDISFNDRQAFYLEVAPRALFNPVGDGLGSTGLATKLSTAGGELGEFGNFDSGLMNIPFVLGWPGSLLYVGGLAWLLFYASRGRGLQLDLFAAASRSIAVAVLIQLIFYNTLVGVLGMVFWVFLGLSLAAQKYHTQDMKSSE